MSFFYSGRSDLPICIYLAYVLFGLSCYSRGLDELTLWGWCPVYILLSIRKYNTNDMTTFNGGSLGSCIDEERSKLRYVMWIAGFSESSNLWTQMALQGSPCSMSVWVSVLFSRLNHLWLYWGFMRCWLYPHLWLGEQQQCCLQYMGGVWTSL